MGVLERLGTSGTGLGAVVVSTLAVYAVVVALTRMAGPRSLAKMSSFDFAATVAGPEVLDDHLRQARLSREELFGQLRSAGVQRLDQVTAVVLETTGELSVLTGGAAVDRVLLAGVRGSERLP